MLLTGSFFPRNNPSEIKQSPSLQHVDTMFQGTDLDIIIAGGYVEDSSGGKDKTFLHNVPPRHPHTTIAARSHENRTVYADPKC